VAQEPELRWLEAGVPDIRADVCQVQSTREETALLFGTLTNADPPQARLERRVLLAPRLAKELAASLARLVQAYEAPLANATPAGTVRSAPTEADAPAAARPLLALVRELGVGFGFERSFKLSAASAQGERLILGVRSALADPAALAAVCRAIGMPEARIAEFEAALPEANTVGFGFEGDERGGVYKVYLEYWEQLWRRLQRDPKDVSPALLFLGFKWSAREPARCAVARYTCHPLLALGGIRQRLETLYEGRTDSPSLEATRAILELAGRRLARGDSFVYVEAEEEGNPRRSFDLNLYKARLPVDALQPALAELAGRYGISAASLAQALAPAANRHFGHLSGGLGREGKDFLTVYYELEAL
jgi:hypothetical protein